ncbi:putative XRE-type DNA-binding protein [Oxalobacteraceae bacterium GrIS 2.11]
MMTKPKNQVYDSVWDAIADTPQEAANLRIRAELIEQIAALINEKNWTQVETASRCGVTQPRINDLLRGRISRFSLDALVNIATALGQQVHVNLEAA